MSLSYLATVMAKEGWEFRSDRDTAEEGKLGGRRMLERHRGDGEDLVLSI
jgi:hypothetical protein